jgi:hypothetical protein
MRSDGSRIYITGQWKNLQVWTDENEDFYVKLSNEGRKYLSGYFKDLIAFKDLTGHLYAINSDGKKVFNNKIDLKRSSNLQKITDEQNPLSK